MQEHIPTVERSIFFYRANIGYGEDNLPIPFDPEPALNVIQALVSTPDWYEEEDEGSALCLFPLVGHHEYPMARFGRVRRSGLPQVERAGKVSDLNIAEDQGLLESIHVVFLPDNVVGAEYNHYGPRVSRLGPYLHRKSEGAVPMVGISPVLRGDASKQLDNLQELHLLEMSVLPSTVETIEQAHQPVGAALRAMAEIPGKAKTLQLILSPDEPGLLDNVKAPLKELLNNQIFRDGAKRLRGKGRPIGGGKLEPFDLLNDDITAKRAMMLVNPRGRALDTDAAFATIVEAYEEYRVEIESSPTVAALPVVH